MFHFLSQQKIRIYFKGILFYIPMNRGKTATMLNFLISDSYAIKSHYKYSCFVLLPEHKWANIFMKTNEHQRQVQDKVKKTFKGGLG